MPARADDRLPRMMYPPKRRYLTILTPYSAHSRRLLRIRTDCPVKPDRIRRVGVSAMSAPAVACFAVAPLTVPPTSRLATR